MNSQYRLFLLLFFLDLLAELTAIIFHWDQLRLLTKPLLMLILLMWFIASSVKFLPLRYYIAAALFFSWLGDIFLLIEEKNPSWFMAGLGSFLLAHIMYILFFMQARKKQDLKRWNSFVITAVAVYTIALFIFLYPHTGQLKIPVAVYALVISTMLLTAIHAFNKHYLRAAQYCIAGAALFVVSDSMLAINKFYGSFPAANVFIMLTYALAQFAITNGSLQYLAGANKNL